MKKFLRRECPIRVLEDEVTWGEFIRLYFKGFIGAILLFIYYVGFIAIADAMGL